jgi:hypothetical protein
VEIPSAYRSKPYLPATDITSEGQNQNAGDIAKYRAGSDKAKALSNYPVVVNKYLAPLAVQSQEAGHIRAAQAGATMNNIRLVSNVTINAGYDCKGRLTPTGAMAKTPYYQTPEIEPMAIGGIIDIYA